MVNEIRDILTYLNKNYLCCTTLTSKELPSSRGDTTQYVSST